MATYEEILKANEQIQTIEFKGNQYASVSQRIKAFRMVCPQGFIRTEMMSNENGVCIFKAEVGARNFRIDKDGNIEKEELIFGVGHACEKEGSTYINESSYIENCETSAVGRALGMAGFGIDMAVASAEEVQNAEQEKPEQKATPEQIKILNEKYKGENLKKLLEKNNLEKIEDMPMKKASELIEKLKEAK